MVDDRAKEQAACYLDGVESLLADMFKEDADNGKLINLPFWDEKREETAQKLNPDTEVFIQNILEAHQNKIKERARCVSPFSLCIFVTLWQVQRRTRQEPATVPRDGDLNHIVLQQGEEEALGYCSVDGNCRSAGGARWSHRS